MPLDTFARRIAVELTGRTRWSADRGPEAFAARHHMELLCDLFFRGNELLHKQLIAVDNRPFKQRIGLDPGRRFFTAVELAGNRGILDHLSAFEQARAADPQAPPTPDQRKALDVRAAVERVSAFATGMPLPLVPTGPGGTYLRAGMAAADPGAEPVRRALQELGRAYTAGQSPADAVENLHQAVQAAGTPDEPSARNVRLELFYNAHGPWRMTAVAYGLALILFGLSRLTLRRTLVIAAALVAAFGVAEHVLGITLRTAILDRAPVSNTYESLLWMGLIAIALGLVAQAVNRSGWYVVAGLAAAEVSVLFAALVPLQDQTNALPAVLRSNFWLILHVLVIVASYGVLLVAAVLGHVYLVKEVLLRRRAHPRSKVSNPIIVQTYRAIQLGLILLTAGTILGGVWAADSWGRFWGWDPKETWALISIVVYFAVLHARYIRWIEDFGLAASAVLGFVAIVWTFYGVNYVMATGLHSYGFGSGGETWVAAWVGAELLFLVACWIRHRSLRAAAPEIQATSAPQEPPPPEPDRRASPARG